MKQIVAFLDEDGNGYMDPGEVKVLISKLTGLAIAEIPDDHYEVAMLANITTAELVDKLWKNTDAEARAFRVLFCAPDSLGLVRDRW